MRKAVFIPMWDTSLDPKTPSHELRVELHHDHVSLTIGHAAEGASSQYKCRMAPAYVLDVARFMWSCAKTLGAL
jgi:hypothetical protein